MELIKIDTDHFVVVDDSEIKEGDFIYGIINGSFEYKKHSSISGYLPKLYSTDKKITHSTNIDWNDVYYIPLQEVKELLGEVDKFELFLDREIELGLSPKDIVERIKWYYQTYFKEDNKAKQYTEEDLKYMFECGRNYQNNAEITFKASFEYLIQTKTSWQVEFVDGKLKLK